MHNGDGNENKGGEMIPKSGGGKGRERGAAATAAAATPELELPYGGDLQEAMRAQDRDAIKVLMRRRDGKLPLDAGGAGATVAAQATGSGGANGDGAEGGGGGGGGALPYGGDLQAAMKAQDRDAIRDIMRARDGKPRWQDVVDGGGSKSGNGSGGGGGDGGGDGGGGSEGLALDDGQIAEAAAAVKKATLGHGGRGKSGKRPSDLELPYGGDLRSVADES